MRGAELVNRSGPALIFDHGTIDGDMLLDGGCTALGYGRPGTVRLVGARIGGQLSARRLTVANTSGPAIRADRLSVDGDLILDEGFDATASSPDGAIRLVACRVGGQVVFGAGVVRNDFGAGLLADRIIANGGLEIDRGLAVSGNGPDGAVRLVGATIGSQLLLREAALKIPRVPPSSPTAYQSTAAF